jgi:hypothetical protein
MERRMPETVTIYSDEELGLGPNWDINPEDGQPLSPSVRRELRESRIRLRRAEEAENRAELAERRLAFASAGVTTDIRGEYFAKGYDGDTSPEAVKAAWEALYPPQGEGSQGAGSTDAQRRIAEAAGGEGGSGPGSAIELGEALKAARGDKKKIMEILASAPPESGVRLKGFD